MELTDDKTPLVTVIAGQPGENSHQTDIINATELDLLSNCQDGMEGAMIIFDNDPNGGHVVKVVASADSHNDLDPAAEPEDPDNFITLHASTIESKNDVTEHNVLVSLNEEIKASNLINSSESLPIIIEAATTASESTPIIIDTGTTISQSTPIVIEAVHSMNESIASTNETLPMKNDSLVSTFTISPTSFTLTPTIEPIPTITKPTFAITEPIPTPMETPCKIEPEVVKIETELTKIEPDLTKIVPDPVMVEPTSITNEPVPSTSESAPEVKQGNCNDDDGEETVATFITSTGQQLALYAVENSDEIFAVALYDESGEPPTNFHFLMKPDVERLIGEGAVKTVKKPSAPKNKDAKPTIKKEKEEIKFDKYQAVIPNIDKPDEIQLQKIEDIKREVVEVPEIPQQIVTSSPKVEPHKTVFTKVNRPTVKTAVAPPKKPIVIKQSIPIQQKPVKIPQPMPVKQVIASNQIITTKQQTPQRNLLVARQAPMKHVVTTKSSNIGKNTTPIVKHVVTTKPLIKSVPGKHATYIRNTVVNQVRTPTLIKQVPPPRQTTFIRQVVPQKRFQTTPKANVIHQGKVVGVVSQNLVERKKEAQITYIVPNDKYTYILAENIQEELESEVEMIEQSTVQYILSDGESDSELTFDEVQASLKSFRKENNNKPIKMRPAWSFNKNVKRESKILIKSETKIVPIIQKRESLQPVVRTYKSSPKKQRTPNNLLQTHRKIKKEIEDSSYGDVNYNFNSSSDILSNSVPRVKPRSRKQQLTVVNRSDSEIIIQPISTISDEEEETLSLPRRRGRRKKQPTKDPDYNPRTPIKNKRHSSRSVEVIEIDIDEADKNDGKKVTSSDKENDEVISLDESDSDSQKKSSKAKMISMQCSHCLRNFRKKRALERHLESCVKSPAYLQKLEERKALEATQEKKFKCKHCDEAFSMALTLARHVRVDHSPKKRGRPKVNKDDDTTEVEESSEDEEEAEEEESDPEILPKKKVRGDTKRNMKKSSTPDIELKLDSSREASTEPPKRRGRPAKKTTDKEHSVTPEVDVHKEEKSSTQSEPRKRGRPSRKSSITKEAKTEYPESSDKEDKFKNIPKKRGRWSERLTKEDPKKRGRPSLKKDEPISDDEEEEDEGETKINKKDKSSVSEQPKRRGRSAKTLSESSDKAEETENVDESKKIGRSTKDKVKSESDMKSQETKVKNRRSKSKSVSESEMETDVVEEEPKRRGRPAKDKTACESTEKSEEKPRSTVKNLKSEKMSKDDDVLLTNKEKSVSLDQEGSSDLDDFIDDLSKNMQEPKTRRRPNKHKTISESEDKIKDTSEMKKRGRPSRDKTLSETDDKTDQSNELPRKRGRLSKDDNFTSESEVKEDKVDAQSQKAEKSKLYKPDSDIEEKVELVSDENKRRVRASKEKTVSELENKSEKRNLSEETVKRGRTAKSFSESDEKIEDQKKKGSTAKDNKLDKEDTGDINDLIDDLSVPVEEPKKRGRPSKEKTPKLEDDDKAIEVALEPKKRGRPSKAEEISDHEDKEPKKKGRLDKPTKEDLMMEVEERMEEMFASLDQPKKRGRPAKNKSVSDQEDKTETDSKLTSKDDQMEHEYIIEELIESNDDSKNLGKSLEHDDEQSNKIEEGKKRGRPSKISKDNDEKPEVEHLTEEEPKRRGRPPKSILKDNQAEVDPLECTVTENQISVVGKETLVETQVKEETSSQTPSSSPKKEEQQLKSPKSSKLSCEDCSEVFSSTSALQTHRLTHRTKKSGTLVYHCATCKKLVPAEAFARHLSSHKRNAPLRTLRFSQ